MPIEEEPSAPVEVDQNSWRQRKSHLRLHAANVFKIKVVTPRYFDDVQVCADYLRAGAAVIINFENLGPREQQRFCDFLQGVCAVTGGSAERVASYVWLYVPEHAQVQKQLFAVSLPTYLKKNNA